VSLGGKELVFWNTEEGVALSPERKTTVAISDVNGELFSTNGKIFTYSTIENDSNSEVSLAYEASTGELLSTGSDPNASVQNFHSNSHGSDSWAVQTGTSTTTVFDGQTHQSIGTFSYPSIRGVSVINNNLVSLNAAIARIFEVSGSGLTSLGQLNYFSQGYNVATNDSYFAIASEVGVDVWDFSNFGSNPPVLNINTSGSKSQVWMDDSNIAVYDYGSDTLRFFDASSFNLKSTLSWDSDDLREDAAQFHDGSFYASVHRDNRVLQINPDSGLVVSQFRADIPGDSIDANLSYDLAISQSGDIWVVSTGSFYGATSAPKKLLKLTQE
jgi:LysM repeat protein